MEFALWTRSGGATDCARVRFETVGVGGQQYLARGGFTSQKPIKRAYKRRPEAVQQGLAQEYPAIERHAKQERGEIQRGHQTALVVTDVRGRSCAPAGRRR